MIVFVIVRVIIHVWREGGRVGRPKGKSSGSNSIHSSEGGFPWDQKVVTAAIVAAVDATTTTDRYARMRIVCGRGPLEKRREKERKRKEKKETKG